MSGLTLIKSNPNGIKDPALLEDLEWFALYTKSRHEKSLCTELTRRGIESFLPLRKIKRQWSDRWMIIEEPLFPSYIFVHTSREQRFDALNAPGSVQFIGANASEPWSISKEEINALQRFVSLELVIDPYPYLAVGQKVRVRKGPLKGVEGFIVRKKKFSRLVVSVDLMKQSVAVEIDPDSVEPLR